MADRAPSLAKPVRASPLSPPGPTRTLPRVNAQDLRDFVFFQDEQVTRRTVFETERLWSEVVCLNLNQALGPITDPSSDAIFTIVSGEAVVQVDRRRRRLKQWRSVLVLAGSEITVTNASPEPLVVMVVAAPPPAKAVGE